MRKYMEHKTAAEILIESAVKTVGKREFLRTVERLYSPKKGIRMLKESTPVETQCQARVKGERTGIKAGRFVLFEAARCPRSASQDGICCIHANQQTKFGELPLGLYESPLTEEQKKVFGEL
jgi:hypothetical protein